MTYIPRKDIMIKLMRGCLDVKTKEELWVNKIEKIVEPVKEETVVKEVTVKEE